MSEYLYMLGTQKNTPCFLHSAKGSSWKNHKYIKRIDGTYYYPDSYEGGRHLSDGQSTGSSGGALEDWEKDLYDDIEETLKRNPGLFNRSDIASNDFQDFRVTLAEFAGVDADKLSDEEVERMRKKVEAHYADSSDDTQEELSATDIENLAREVIRGNFGNGQVRKDLLGEDYQIIQDRVNEILLGSSGSNSSGEAASVKATRIEDAKSKLNDQTKLATESAVKKLSDTKTDLTKAMEKAITTFVDTGKNLKNKKK